MCGQVARENRLVSVSGQLARESRPIFFKRGRLLKIMRSFSFFFLFLFKLNMQDIDDVLVRKHCKDGASVVTHFLVPTQK